MESWQSICGAATYEHTTAIVIKMKSGDGTVKIFYGDRKVLIYQTHLNSGEDVLTIFLEPGYYCWWMLEAGVKYIKIVEKA